MIGYASILGVEANQAPDVVNFERMWLRVSKYGETQIHLSDVGQM